MKVKGLPQSALKEQRFVVAGAGSAGMGVVRMICQGAPDPRCRSGTLRRCADNARLRTMDPLLLCCRRRGASNLLADADGRVQDLELVRFTTVLEREACRT